MTFYTLIRHVEYEGSSFIGNFASVDAVFAYLKQRGGYMMDAAWHPTSAELEPLEEEYDLDRASVTGGWYLDAPSDLSFSIYACSVEVS